MKEKIVFAGGDKRQLYAARKLRQSGYDVYTYGFDSFGGDTVPALSDIYMADIIVLPVTGVRDGIVPVYYSDKEIKLDFDKLKDKTVIMGKKNTLGDLRCRVYDLLDYESFTLANALPTAEGAVMIASEQYEGTIAGSKILVIGYGRIGKVLSRMLRALDADVSVASRSDEKACCIVSDGNTPVNTAKLESLGGYDIVFNTADALVIDEKMLMKSDNSTVITDLASAPGGVDFEAAKRLGFKTIHALGLPGKYSPKAAGGIISDTVQKIIES